MVPRWWKHRIAARRAHQGMAMPEAAGEAGKMPHHGL
jgi:hypothetical protein